MGDAALLTAGRGVGLGGVRTDVRLDGRGFAKAFPEIGSGVRGVGRPRPCWRWNVEVLALE